MRRNEKEIEDREAIEAVIRRSKVCRLALCSGEHPYIVPLCFGYRDETLYFHSVREGKKIDILRENPRVAFEFDIDQEVVPGKTGCDWTMRYKSVVGFGRASFVEDLDAKRKALDVIMAQYADGSFTYKKGVLKITVVIKVEIDRMTGKKSD